MSDAVIIAICTAVPPTLVALGAFIVGIRNSAKADSIKTAVDGVLAERVQAAQDIGRAEGKEAGIAQQKEETRETGRKGD
jgi:hypothetical protein